MDNTELIEAISSLKWSIERLTESIDELIEKIPNEKSISDQLETIARRVRDVESAIQNS
jgi:hypothetical protein